MAYMTRSGKCESRIVYPNVNSVNTTTRKFAITSPIKIPPHFKCAIFFPPLGDNLTIHLHSELAFQNGSEYRNVDFRLIGNHFCTSCRNLVRFGFVIRSLRRKNLFSQPRIFYWSYFIAYWACNYQLMRIFFIFCSDGFPYVFAPVFSTPAFSTPAYSAPPNHFILYDINDYLFWMLIVDNSCLHPYNFKWFAVRCPLQRHNFYAKAVINYG